METRDPVKSGSGRRRKLLWLRVAFTVAVLFVAVWWVLAPQYAAAGKSLESLEKVSPLLVVTAVVLELLSLAAYSVLSASILGPGRPSYFTILRIDLAGLAVNHMVPGGGATAAAARFRLLHRAGVRSPNALSAAAIEVTASNLVLGAIFAVGLLMTRTTAWSNGFYRTAAIAILAALLVTGTGIWFLTRRTDATVVKVHAVMRLVPLIIGEVTEAFLRMMAAQIQYLGRNLRKMAFDLIFAAANWILDAAALWLVLSAFGHNLGLGPLLTVYGAGNILAILPLTPGGLGPVEGVMVPALLGFGTPATAIRGGPQQFQRRRWGTLKRAARR